MKPYYQHAGITVYHGDCREILSGLESIDLVLTDPPYGVELGTSDQRLNAGHGLHKRPYSGSQDTREQFLSVVLPAIKQALSVAKRGAVFSGPNITDLPRPTTVGGIYCSAAVGRSAWGFTCFLPVAFYGKCPTQHLGPRANVLPSNARAKANGHPCPKPLEWLSWLVSFCSIDSETILDPFLGSGTTLVAAKNLNRQAIGIEIEEKYCEIAAKRLSQEVLQFSVGNKHDVN